MSLWQASRQAARPVTRIALDKLRPTIAIQGVASSNGGNSRFVRRVRKRNLPLTLWRKT